MAFNISVREFVEVFPEREKNAQCEMYDLLIRFIMHQIVNDIKSQAEGQIKPFRIAFIHDRCDCDGALLKGFNSVKDDVSFEGREYFTTIAPKSWEDCLLLQTADMAAYESFKDAANSSKAKPRARRKSLNSLLQEESLFGGRSMTLTRKALELVREEKAYGF